MAVSPEGRRQEGEVDVDVAAAAINRATSVVVLDHAGPRASSWMSDRAVAATDTPDLVTGRKARALDDEGWARITEAYAQAAARIPDAVLGVDDDGLLQHALSPRTGLGVDRALPLVLAIHRACGGRDVALTVEELCPGGFDATDGIAIARALIAQGARRIYASGGTDALAPLKERVKGSDERASHHASVASLASAAWLVGRIGDGVEVFAVVPFVTPGVDEAARELGLAGVVLCASAT